MPEVASKLFIFLKTSKMTKSFLWLWKQKEEPHKRCLNEPTHNQSLSHTKRRSKLSLYCRPLHKSWKPSLYSLIFDCLARGGEVEKSLQFKFSMQAFISDLSIEGRKREQNRRNKYLMNAETFTDVIINLFLILWNFSQTFFINY